MFWDLLGALLGSFFATFIIYNLVIISFNFIARYKVLPVKVSIYSFVISILVIAFILEALNNWGYFIYYYSMLILIFIIEYRRHVYQKCPYCSEKIKSDAIKCKYCHSTLGEKDVNI